MFVVSSTSYLDSDAAKLFEESIVKKPGNDYRCLNHLQIKHSGIASSTLHQAHGVLGT
jgi:hypothetical protein